MQGGRDIISDRAVRSVVVMLPMPSLQFFLRIASTNLLQRLHHEVKPGSNVIGIFLNGKAILPLDGALMPKTDDEWAFAWRCRSPRSPGPRHRWS